jgi:uncharacterized protein (DUF1697 family)
MRSSTAPGAGRPVTNRYVALVRGINNIGAAKRIAMADLRRIFEDLGFEEVRTLLNSGNVVFTAARSSADDLAASIEKAIAERCGVTPRVMVLKRREIAAAVEGNPLKSIAADPSRLLVMTFRDLKASAQVKPLLKERWKPEALALGGRFAYIWCANGVGESRVWPAVSRIVGDAGTARNIATMTKLLALVRG